MGYIYTLLLLLSQELLGSVGIHMIMSLSGIVFLGFPALLIVIRYTLAIAEKSGFDPWLATLMGLVASLVMSVFFIALHRRLSMDSFIVVGLSSVLAFQALASSWTEVTNGVLGLGGLPRPALFSSLPALTALGLSFALFALLFEWVLLKSPLGRQLRGFKEAPLVISSLGISKNHLSSFVFIVGGIFFSLSGFLFVWQTQFLDPRVGGLPLLVEVLTVGILAQRPYISHVIAASIFVLLLPETLRFLDLPATVFAQARVMIYSGLLIVLIYFFKDKITLSNRTL